MSWLLKQRDAKKREQAENFYQRSIFSSFRVPDYRHVAKTACNHVDWTSSRAGLVSEGSAQIVTNCMASSDIFSDPLCNDEVMDGDGCTFWGFLSLANIQAGESLVEGKVIMSDSTDMLIRLSERIRCATSGTTGLDAKEVASILCEIEDVGARRMILSRFMATACCRGDVSEAVAWTVVMSHMEGRRPSADVQLEAKHLINAH
jgi:hypothetical protein